MPRVSWCWPGPRRPGCGPRRRRCQTWSVPRSSEVDEYQRIEVLVLEPARLSGGAVTDVAHLLAELLENAVQFSPSSETVRVTGLFDSRRL